MFPTGGGLRFGISAGVIGSGCNLPQASFRERCSDLNYTAWICLAPTGGGTNFKLDCIYCEGKGEGHGNNGKALGVS